MIDTATNSPGSEKFEMMIEEFCFRCGEAGNLLPCDRDMCPKAYHPLCVGKEAWPSSKWMCPWHFCAHRDCSKIMEVNLLNSIIFILVIAPPTTQINILKGVPKNGDIFYFECNYYCPHNFEPFK